MRTRQSVRQQGMSLVEIMVGMVIGMLVMLVIYQLYAAFEGQKRTTSGSSDAQTTGLFAMTAIDQDVRMAGWGMFDSVLMGCTRIDSYDSTHNPANGNPLFSSFLPVRIVDGGSGPGASDTIILKSSSNFNAIAPAVVNDIMSNASAELGVSSTFGFVEGDIVVVASGPNCTVGQVTHVQPSAAKIQRNPGTSIYNPEGGYRSSNFAPEVVGARLYRLGTIIQKTYSVAGTNLQLQDSSAAGPLTLADNIVSIKASYGISAAPGSQSVVQWTRATNTGAGSWANPVPADAMRIKAVRLAVVTRSPLREKPDASGNCSATTVAPTSWAATAADPSPPVVDLSSNPDWRCYRYRVFQTIIPLRNVLWGNV